ncbi:uncharacterized protein LOC117178563 [Belonocnema kinseyi]|uniref:uncharacterized protein LOC117178563 n=1 Tax=Belonocnema kinseyi TaxID=2817044 RepID=UPI00143D5FD9|nr:uncharacterized protein LOC117178563 [Belonocnema kinseyi]
MIAVYPEFVALDVTYKLLRMGLPVYVTLSEDVNCQSEILAVCILVNEDRESILWFLNTFKEENPEILKLNSIITDKDLNERGAIRVVFPAANFIICIFHVQRTFRREITFAKMNITQSQRNESLEILVKLVYAPTTEKFEELERDFTKKAPLSVLNYYNKNWLPISNARALLLNKILLKIRK